MKKLITLVVTITILALLNGCGDESPVIFPKEVKKMEAISGGGLI